MELFLTTFATLFSVLSPVGNLPVFLGLTQNDSVSSKNKTALWTAINVFIILTISFFVGEYILKFFGITINALRIAGGILICMAGFGLLSGKMNEQKPEENLQENKSKSSNIAMTPLAIPLMAGPGSMSLLIDLYDKNPDILDKMIVILGVFSVAVTIYITFRSGNYIIKFLGNSGMTTLSKIIGLLVLSIGIQYILVSILKIFNLSEKFL